MKLDSNGYAESLFNTEEDVCYICGRHVPTARHEVIYGSNRGNSKKYGLWINVCPDCHQNRPGAIHKIPKEYEWLKVEAQELFEQRYHDKDFLTIFGKRYKDVEIERD